MNRVGDLLLCSGNSFQSRKIIRYNHLFFSNTQPSEAKTLSHVAAIGPSESDVFESTTLNKWCGKSGVQFNDFDAWLSNYNGKVWIRRQRPGSIQEKARIRIQSKMLSLIGTRYESGIPGLLELLTAGICLPFIRTEVSERLRTKTSIHCTESISLALKYAAILEEWRRPSKLPPVMWWNSIQELDTYYNEPELLKE